MRTSPDSARSLRGGGAATPRIPGFFADSLAADGIDTVLRAIERGELAYPLVDRCPDQPGLVHVTFLWLDEPGKEAASNVILSANALVDHEDLEASEFELVRTGVWALTLRVPDDWIASYRITVHRGPGLAPWRAATERRPIRLAADAGGVDPLNPRTFATMHGAPVSVVRGPRAPRNRHLAAAQPALDHSGPSLGGQGLSSAPQPDPEHPRLSHHVLWDENCRRERSLWMYQPAAESLVPGTKTPLAIVHDGATWARYLSIAESLDAAVAAGDLAPLHVLFIDSTDNELRAAELPVASGTTRSVAEQFLPWARTFFEVSHQPEHTLVSGASFGGLASVLAVLEHPQLIGLAVAQSPSLWHTDLHEPLRTLDSRVRMVIQAGCYETTINDSCREALEALEGTPARGQIDFQPISGGHDWTWWAPLLLSGLSEFFPGSRHE